MTRMKKNIFTAVCLFLLGLGLCGCSGDTGEETMEILRGQAPGKEEGLLRVGLIQTDRKSVV